MGMYRGVLAVVVFLLAAVCVWSGVRAYQRGMAEEDEKRRKTARWNALLWTALGLMFGLSGLYAVFLVSWLFWVVILLGTLAVGSAIGTGLGLNMREH